MFTFLQIKTGLYTGVTNNLKERLYFHANPEPFSKAFTTKYNCFYLMYYEHFLDINVAIGREKKTNQRLFRAKKETLISNFNQNWNFLNNDI